MTTTAGDAEAYRRLDETLRKHRGDIEAWRRLGGLLRIQRQLFDRRYANRALFAKERGVNYKLVSDVEQPPPDPGDLRNVTLEKVIELAEAYGVTYQSVGAALDGGELVPLAGMESQRPHLTAVPSPEDAPHVLKRARDLFPFLEPAEKARAERYYQRIEGRLAGAAAAEARRRGVDIGVVLDEMYAGPPGFIPDGAELFGEGAPEADWWDGAKGQGQVSGLSSALQIAQIVSVVQARNPREQENAGGGLAAP